MFSPSLNLAALRIGDAVAAKEIYESNSASCEENDDTKTAILNLLTALAQHQGSGANIWEAMGLPQLPLQYTSVIGEACERAKKQGDDYRTGSLSLLGGIDELPTATLPGLNTIEDYLFGLLWLALRKPEPVSELKAVGKKILSYGSNYFGEEQGGWSYAFPLFVAQQYQTALLFLQQAGGATGLMQATHLGMLLTSCGVALNNLGETNPQPEYKLFTSLLVEYGTWLHADPNNGAVCALDYLRWLPDRNVLAKEVHCYSLSAVKFFVPPHILFNDCVA